MKYFYCFYFIDKETEVENVKLLTSIYTGSRLGPGYQMQAS